MTTMTTTSRNWVKKPTKPKTTEKTTPKESLLCWAGVLLIRDPLRREVVPKINKKCGLGHRTCAFSTGASPVDRIWPEINLSLLSLSLSKLRLLIWQDLVKGILNREAKVLGRRALVGGGADLRSRRAQKRQLDNANGVVETAVMSLLLSKPILFTAREGLGGLGQMK